VSGLSDSFFQQLFLANYSTLISMKGFRTVHANLYLRNTQLAVFTQSKSNGLSPNQKTPIKKGIVAQHWHMSN